MTDAIEPIPPTNKKKRITNLFLVVPPPPVPIKWEGISLIHELTKIMFTSVSRVIDTTLENFQWEKREKEKRTKEDRKVDQMRRFQKGLDKKTFYNLKVAEIHRA